MRRFVEWKWIALLLAASMAAGCKEQKKNEFVAPPPPTVTVAHPIERVVENAWEFTGSTEAIETVEVRARVSGFIDKIHFDADRMVTAGQLLFTIDPRIFESKLAQSQANVEVKRADLKLAEVNLQRVKELFASKAASEFEVTERTANFERAQADVKLAEALVTSDKLNVEWAQVKAPITGRISRNLVDRGALVGQDGPTLLATIVNDEKIYVYFNVSDRDMLEYLNMHPKAREIDANERHAERKIFMALGDETGYPREGLLDSAEPKVDPDTGTLRLRAVFSNPNRLVPPGLFVRVKMPKNTQNSMLIADIAVGTDQGGRNVLVVNDKNIVERRGVTVGAVVGHMRRIEKGLLLTDRVVINGLQRARPGAVVNPIFEGQSPATQAATAPATSPSSAK